MEPAVVMVLLPRSNNANCQQVGKQLTLQSTTYLEITSVINGNDRDEDTMIFWGGGGRLQPSVAAWQQWEVGGPNLHAAWKAHVVDKKKQ